MDDPSLFWEWQQDFLTLSKIGNHRLQRVEAIIGNLEQHSVLKSTIRMAVVAPLWNLSELCLPPFYIGIEDTVEIAAIERSRQFVLGQDRRLSEGLKNPQATILPPDLEQHFNQLRHRDN